MELSLIVNPTTDPVLVQEQSAYEWVFLPLRSQNYVASGFAIAKWGRSMEAFNYLNSATAGHYVKYRFRGRRIGVLLQRAATGGVLAFDVDGTSYGSFNTGGADATYFNVPYTIATDLTDTEHLLTITKSDSVTTSLLGWLVDSAGAGRAWTRVSIDYHQQLDETKGLPVNILTTDTSITYIDSVWVLKAIITNTTAAVINVTLKNNAGASIVGPFPVAANDIKEVQGPIYFASGLKVSADAEGCRIVVALQ